MKKKKYLFILFLIIPLILSGCTFAFGPGGGGGKNQPVTGKGIYKTGNKGADWVEQNSLEGSEVGIGETNVHKLAFDIFDSKILYRSTNNGLFISENAGESWKRLSSSSVGDFTLNPKTRGIIYMANGNKVYITTDNGENWDLVYTEARSNISIKSVQISYFDTSYIYLLASDGAVLLSNNWGESWQTIYAFKKRIKAKELFIDPHDSNNMFIAATDKFYVSTDQGLTWTETMADLKKEFPGINLYKKLYFTKKANNLIYLSKYGILKSSDNGVSWQPVTLITAPNTVDINALAFDPDETSEIYYTIGKILYHTVDNGENWKTRTLPIPGGTKTSCLLVDPGDTNSIYLGVTQ